MPLKLDWDTLSSVPFVALASHFICIGLVLGILLIDTVVGQVHELIAKTLHGRGIPGRKQKAGVR